MGISALRSSLDVFSDFSEKKKRRSSGHIQDHLRISFSDMATTPVGSEHGHGSGMGICVPGVMRVTLAPQTQHHLGCVIGKDVTAEHPWISVNKSLIDDNMDLHSDSSDFLPVRDELAVSIIALLFAVVKAFPHPQFLILITVL